MRTLNYACQNVTARVEKLSKRKCYLDHSFAYTETNKHAVKTQTDSIIIQDT